MSDGPHRSLPMRRAWKKVAERVYNAAFPVQDIPDWFCRAVEEDCSAELPERLLRDLSVYCLDRQPTFFEEDRATEVSALRRQSAGLGTLGGVLIDSVLQARAEGQFGENALRQAISNAVQDRVQRDLKSVEEHYYRRARTLDVDVRERLGQAAAQTSLDAVVSRLMNIQPRPTVRPDKHEGLDDGVPL
jgi:hypothetical protein